MYFLIKVEASIYVPDCQNMLNYTIEDSFLVKAPTLKLAKERVEEEINSNLKTGEKTISICIVNKTLEV